MHMSWLSFALMFVVAAGFTVESAMGFGATVTTLSLTALIAPTLEVLPAYIPLNLALSSYLVVRYAPQIAWGVLIARVAPFVAVGMAAGFAIGARISRSVGLRIFGAFVLCLALAEAHSRLRPRVDTALKEPSAAPPAPEAPLRTWARDIVAMTLCGALFGMYATGGPLAVWSVSHHARRPAVFRATLALLWLVLNGIFFYRLHLAHKVTAESFRSTLLFVPALIIGTAVGEWLHRRVSAATFRSIVFSLLFCVGLVLLIRG
jgi:uncharacterized membrane protein YfcA